MTCVYFSGTEANRRVPGGFPCSRRHLQDTLSPLLLLGRFCGELRGNFELFLGCLEDRSAILRLYSQRHFVFSRLEIPGWNGAGEPGLSELRVLEYFRHVRSQAAEIGEVWFFVDDYGYVAGGFFGRGRST